MSSSPRWWSRDSDAEMVHFAAIQLIKAGRPPSGKVSAASAAETTFSVRWVVFHIEGFPSLKRDERSLTYRNIASPLPLSCGLLKSPVKTRAIPSVCSAVSINHSASIIASKWACNKAPFGILLTIFHNFVCSILSRARLNIIPGNASEPSSPFP